MLSYIFLHRKKEIIFSFAWFKLWAKRFYRLPQLIKINYNLFFWKTRGARVGSLSIVESIGYPGKMANISVGAEAFIAKSAKISTHGCTSIGDRVVINSNVRILTGSHSSQDPDWKLICRDVVINDYVWVAEGAVVLPGVTIGKGAVIGAFAVVRDDVAPYTIVIGNPARPLKKLRCENLRYSPVVQTSYIEAWLGSVKV